MPMSLHVTTRLCTLLIALSLASPAASLAFAIAQPRSPPQRRVADEATHIHNIFRNFSMSE